MPPGPTFNYYACVFRLALSGFLPSNEVENGFVASKIVSNQRPVSVLSKYQNIEKFRRLKAKFASKTVIGELSETIKPKLHPITRLTLANEV